MPKLYEELAPWWPLMSAPADYAEEAAFYQRLLEGAATQPLLTLLELGSGGGNNASHLKARFDMVLVEPAPGMLALSRALNPECEHLPGDMRTARLGREFDGVFGRENFQPSTDHGGHDDAEGGGLRYVGWCHDPDPADNTYVVDYAYLLRSPDGMMRVEHDRHVEGLFTRAEWLRLLHAAGFQARSVPLEHSEVEPGTHEVFVAIKPRVESA